MPQVIEVRYANGAQLASLLTRLFGGQATYKVRLSQGIGRNRWRGILTV